MKMWLVVIAFALFGCATSPAIRTPVPAAPIELMAEPAKLKPLPSEPLVLSNFADSVVDNYSIANQVRLQLVSLQSWIRQITELSNK